MDTPWQTCGRITGYHEMRGIAMIQSPLEAEVVQRRNDPNAWGVEAIDRAEGSVYMAVFSGPEARERAEEYARLKYCKALAA
jgi:hypothetical protein